MQTTPDIPCSRLLKTTRFQALRMLWSERDLETAVELDHHPARLLVVAPGHGHRPLLQALYATPGSGFKVHLLNDVCLLHAGFPSCECWWT